MSSSKNRNEDDPAGSSQRKLDEHYRLMEEEMRQEKGMAGGEESDETTDGGGDEFADHDAHDGGDERGCETTDSGAAGGGSTSTSEAKRQRKKRRPNVVGSTKESFTAVDPKTGIPTEPKHLARGYGLQLAAIVRDVVNVNETKLRTKKKQHLQEQLLKRLHARYQFPEGFTSLDPKENIVNRFALTRFTKGLSSYKTMLRGMIGDNESWEEIQRHFPRLTSGDYMRFLENEELEYTKDRSAWGKELAEKNIGHHRLGCRGYDGVKEKWQKENRSYVEKGIENPWDKYKDPLFMAFVRSRYRKEMDGKLVTNPTVVEGVALVADPKVVEVEKAVVSNFTSLLVSYC